MRAPSAAAVDLTEVHAEMAKHYRELASLHERLARQQLALANEPTPADEVLDTDGAAKLLKRHPKVIAQYARSGQLRAKKLGQEWRFKRADVLAFVETEQRNDVSPNEETEE